MKRCTVLVVLFSLLSGNTLCPLSFINMLLTQSPKSTEETYLIESGDVLEIVVLGEEELTRTVMVMHNGNISFPLAGDVAVAGLTTEQAASVLASRLTTYYTHPVVSIIIQSPTLPYVSVFGEVVRQGAIDYQRGLRVTEYIALAGGPSPRANLSQVKVVRFGSGKPVMASTYSINVDKIIKEGLAVQNLELKSGDWIYVPEKFTVNWGTILSTFTLLVAIANLYITIDRLPQ